MTPPFLCMWLCVFASVLLYFIMLLSFVLCKPTYFAILIAHKTLCMFHLSKLSLVPGPHATFETTQVFSPKTKANTQVLLQITDTIWNHRHTRGRLQLRCSIRHRRHHTCGLLTQICLPHRGAEVCSSIAICKCTWTHPVVECMVCSRELHEHIGVIHRRDRGAMILQCPHEVTSIRHWDQCVQLAQRYINQS